MNGKSLLLQNTVLHDRVFIVDTSLQSQASHTCLGMCYHGCRPRCLITNVLDMPGGYSKAAEPSKAALKFDTWCPCTSACTRAMPGAG